jgi:tRNA pseudouridine13 synthase
MSETRHDGPAALDPLAGVPYLTDDVPPIGGELKRRPEDFLVEEIPLYQPSGEGEHIYLMVEKRGLSTSDLIEILSRHFEVPDRAIGYAGMKDKLAITRQVVSIHAPGRTPEDFPMLDHERVAILWADLHTNKLRLGHLRGNRFIVRARGVDPMRVVDAKRVLDRLAAEGAPNLFGAQRFGAIGVNHELGRLLLSGDHAAMVDLLLSPAPGLDHDHASEARALYAAGRIGESLEAWPGSARSERSVLRSLSGGASPREAVTRLPRVQLRFWISAFQAAIFNGLLGERLRDRTHHRLLVGDVAMKHANGAQFDVDEQVAEDPDTLRRLASIEISPSGPIWGPRTKPARGAVGRREAAALAATGVTAEAVGEVADELGVSAAGDRRPYRVPVRLPGIEGGADEHGTYLRASFELPRGSFATMVMREILKSDAAAGGAGDAGEGEGDRG